MNTKNNNNLGRFLGTTQDNIHRNIDVFADEETMYIVYCIGTKHEYITSRKISTIKENLDEHLFTPYIEFIGLVD